MRDVAGVAAEECKSAVEERGGNDKLLCFLFFFSLFVHVTTLSVLAGLKSFSIQPDLRRFRTPAAAWAFGQTFPAARHLIVTRGRRSLPSCVFPQARFLKCWLGAELILSSSFSAVAATGSSARSVCGGNLFGQILLNFNWMALFQMCGQVKKMKKATQWKKVINYSYIFKKGHKEVNTFSLPYYCCCHGSIENITWCNIYAKHNHYIFLVNTLQCI